MPTGIKIPKLGLTMTEATLVGWSVGTGETPATDQTVCVIETDKVSLEVPSPAAGLVHPVVEAGRHAAVDGREIKNLEAAMLNILFRGGTGVMDMHVV